jgi:phenylacetate-CoA ligase
MDDKFFDGLEARHEADRERALMTALQRQIAHAKASTTAYAELLAGVSPSDITGRSMLATLPVTRKSGQLLQRQSSLRHQGEPFGGFSSIGWQGCRRTRGTRRVFQSPGPLYEPEGYGGDFERVARAMFAAGFRPGDLVHNSFSYHLTPAGAMMEAGAISLGCTVFPGGVGNTDLQLAAIMDLQPTCYVGTPSFLRMLVERAATNGDTFPIRRALVSGEAFPPVAHAWLQERGIDAYQCYATADVGLIAYETQPRQGMVVDEGVVVEIVRPGTGDPVPAGEVGELVVTSLNPDYPLIRFCTGDLSAILPGTCPTGRTNIRIKGWMGRADQAAKVRGMFVSPGQVAELMRRHPEVVRARLVVSGGAGQQTWASDQMTLKTEVTDSAATGIEARLTESMRGITKLRAEVEIVPPGSLPNDGKLIEDLRDAPVAR